MLKIINLCVSVADKAVLNGINLQINAGEVHAIMGPNGSGKSTLANVLAGDPKYQITSGEIIYKGKNLLELSAAQRAQAGLFLGFQYPVEIPGVTNVNFLKASLNAIRTAQGKNKLDAIEFLTVVREKIALLEMDETFLYRSLNEGFSGGEKKKNELLQMALLEPSLAILDETDSGLDIDSLKIVAQGVNQCRHKDRAILLITHYQRLLDYIVPDYVHVLMNGKIVKSGDKKLALSVEQTGYQMEQIN